MLTDTGCTAKNSMSLMRQPGPLSASVRGQSTNYPFLPGELAGHTVGVHYFTLEQNVLQIPSYFYNPFHDKSVGY